MIPFSHSFYVKSSLIRVKLSFFDSYSAQNAFGLHFRRNHQVSIEKKTSRAISRKIRGSRKPRASRIAKQRKTTQDTGVRRGGMAMHLRQNKHGRALVHGQPCVGANFRLFICFSLGFPGDFEPSFGNTLGRNLGFSIASINPLRGD